MVVAGYLYFSAPDPTAEIAPTFLLDVAETEMEFTDCVAGEKREVVFRLDNRSGKPMRVLGLPGC